MGYKPLQENGKTYVSKDGNNRFLDWNLDPLEFNDHSHAKSWCDARNEIDKII